MRGDLQQAVAFGDGLPDEAELAVLEVADASVDHVARCGRGTGAVVTAFDECDVDTLEGQVTEDGHPVDAAANDEDAGVRAARERPDGCAQGA